MDTPPNIREHQHHPLVAAMAAELRARRAAADATLDQATELTHVSRATLHKFERGQRTPNVEQLAKIATGYRTTVAALILAAEARMAPPDAAVSESVSPDEPLP